MLCLAFTAQFAQAQCSASFTYSVAPNGLVIFNSTSSGSISSSASYTWGFSSQATPTFSTGVNIPNVSATYTATGTYTVILGVYDPSTGVWCNTSQVISVNAGTTTPNPCNLNANFSYSQFGNGGVNFFNSSTGTSSGTGYTWSFGDGTASSANSPSHTYTASGTYFVSLTAAENSTCTSTYTATVVVTVCNLNANFTYTQSANGSVSFNNTTSGNLASVAYVWHFGDGNTSTAVSPTHNYATNGTYIAYLVATNSVSPQCNDSISHPITVNSSTCVANTTFSLMPAGTPHAWYAVVTNTANVAAAQWMWGDGSANGFGIVTSHTYAAAGTYSICLTVTTTCGAIGTYCTAQYLNKTSGESADIIYINCITPDMLPSTDTGIKNNSAALISCVISPNPTNGEFNVNANGINSSSAKIQVYNLVGTIVFENMADINNGSINKDIKLENIANGVYFIKVSAGDKIHTQKLVINK